jgi:hypothetical protein
VNLPIGSYTLTYTADGIRCAEDAAHHGAGDRTGHRECHAEGGQDDDTVEVEASPLMNATDTTNGYVMDKQQIDDSASADRELYRPRDAIGGRERRALRWDGRNSGLGNAPIWANGQRDTSNSASAERRRRQQPVQRQEHQPGLLGARDQLHRRADQPRRRRRRHSVRALPFICPSATPFPRPRPRPSQEVRVNASMYDAQQGSTSGAHID